MKRYVIVDPTTREIVSLIRREDNDPTTSTPIHCIAIEIERHQSLSHATHYLGDDQSFIEYTDEQMEAKAAKPSPFAVWHNDLMRWIVEESPEYEQHLKTTVLNERSSLLNSTDFVTLRATEKGEPIPAPWIEYRQQLRDMTKQQNFPFNVVWPEVPK